MAKSFEDFFTGNVVVAGRGNGKNVQDAFAEAIDNQIKLAKEEMNGGLTDDERKKAWWRKYGKGWRVTPKWQRMTAARMKNGKAAAIDVQNPKDLMKEVEKLAEANQAGIFDKRLKEIREKKKVAK